MRRARSRPDAAANFAEAQQQQRLQHEWFLNSVVEARNPGIQPTERYSRGALPPRDARFGSRLDYLRYRTRREMGKYDPNIDYPTAPQLRGRAAIATERPHSRPCAR